MINNNIFLVPILFLTTLLFTNELLSQESFPPFTIERSQVIEFPSESVGKDYQLYIKLPLSYQSSDKKYPLLLLSDADYAFPLVSSLLRQLGDYGDYLEEALLVGVSYSKGDSSGVSRTRDYTPSHSPNERSGHSQAAREVSGGADRYTQFLANEVIPYLNKHYRINLDKKVYAGHSFGGLLGAYMLVNQPETFDYYILGSPSLWYDEKVIFKMEEVYAQKHTDLNAKVFMATGSLENKGMFNMKADMNALADKLGSRRYKGLSLATKEIEGGTHLTMYPTFIIDALQWAIPRK